MNIPKAGLRELPKDERDFKLGAIFQLPELSELPKDFVLEGYDVKFQGDTDFCSAFMVVGMSELQEGVKLSPEYQFALSKELSGDPESWGQDLRTACSTAVKLGSLKQSDAPYSLENRSQELLRDIKNWPAELKEKATKHQKQSYFAVTGKYDAFDNARVSLYKWRDEKRAVGFGCTFSWSLSQVFLESLGGQGFGHAVYAVGQKTVNDIPYLVIVNSYGKEAGDNGTHLMSREVFNYYADIYGVFMLIDKPREEIEWMLQNKIVEGDSWVIQLWKVIKTIVLSPFLTNQEKTNIVKLTDDTLKKVEEETKKTTPPTTPPPKYLWDTPAQARHSVRVICDEDGLTVEQKNLICAVIQCESGFNIKAVNKNTNGTADYGIIQANTYWYIGKGKPLASIEEALNDPEKCVRIMIKRFKQGGLTDWVCFSGNYYQRFL